MEIELIVSIIAICGFAVALTYNIYEFRKVGKHLDALTKTMQEGHKELGEVMQKGHKELVAALKSLSASKSKHK